MNIKSTPIDNSTIENEEKNLHKNSKENFNFSLFDMLVYSYNFPFDTSYNIF